MLGPCPVRGGVGLLCSARDQPCHPLASDAPESLSGANGPVCALMVHGARTPLCRWKCRTVSREVFAANPTRSHRQARVAATAELRRVDARPGDPTVPVANCGRVRPRGGRASCGQTTNAAREGRGHLPCALRAERRGLAKPPRIVAVVAERVLRERTRSARDGRRAGRRQAVACDIRSSVADPNILAGAACVTAVPGNTPRRRQETSGGRASAYGQRLAIGWIATTSPGQARVRESTHIGTAL